MLNVSILSVFGIILVVLGHSSYPGNRMLWVDYIYSFHMPLFAFISGFCFFSYTSIIPFRTYVSKKVQRLIFPYCFWIFFMYIVKIICGAHANNPVTFEFSKLFSMLLYPQLAIVSYYWFLIVLFLIFLTVGKAIKTYIRYNLVIVLSLITLKILNPFEDCSLFLISRFFDLLLYFYLGVLWKLYNIRINYEKYLEILFILGNVILIYYLSYIAKYDIFTGTLGICLMIILSKIYIKYRITLLSHIEGKTASIYLLHGIFNSILSVVLMKLNIDMYMFIFIQFFTCLYMPIIIIKLYDLTNIKNKYINCILGK